MNMDFGGYLKKSWDKFQGDIAAWVVFTLVGSLLMMTIVLIPTAVRGTIKASLDYVRTGKKPEMSLLWNFEGYVDMLLLVLVAGSLISVGMCLLVVPGILLSVIWFYSAYYMVDKGLGFWEAMTASKDAVLRTGFWNHLIVNIIFSVINSLGGSLAGFGVLLTAPYTIIMMTYVYTDLQGENLS